MFIHYAFCLRVQVTFFIVEGCVPANRRVYQKRVIRETCKNHYFDVKLALELFDANLQSTSHSSVS